MTNLLYKFTVMKTNKNKLADKKAKSNAFDNALIRLGQHFLPQQTLTEVAVVRVPVGKKA